MADIVLKNRNGDPVEYPGVDVIKVNTTDGEVQSFGAYDPETLTPEVLAEGVTVGNVTGALSVPDILENLPIALDFSNGNQTITAPDGKAVKSAIIQKPETLIPDNIAEGVSIAGIIGALAGGANIKFAQGSFTGKGANEIIEHGLGVVPDIFVVYKTGNSSAKKLGITMVVGLSTAMVEATGATYCQFAITSTSYSTSSYVTVNMNTSIKTLPKYYAIDAPGDYSSYIYSATETSIIIGSNMASMAQPEENMGYVWFAVGGLT